MSGENLRDIPVFLAVARERSFTRAAARLGMSQSALSHTIRALEQRLGLRLLTRTTRSVAPTEAGQRLIQRVGPRFEAIAEYMAAFEELRDTPAGTVRITASDFAARTFLWPSLSRLQNEYPEVRIEIAIEPGPADVVAQGFDAGVRFGDQVAKDMAAARISPDIRMMIVGAPSYLDKRPAPTSPSDLIEHDCINLRFSARDDLCAWDLDSGLQNLEVRVTGPWIFNSIYPAIEAALAGSGLAYIPQDAAGPYVSSGSLVSVLEDWCPTVPGLHIFFDRRRKSSPALSLIVETLRYRE